MSGAMALMLGAGSAGVPVLVATSAVASGGSSVSIGKPAGVQAGDLLVAVMASIGSVTWSAVSGWTEIASIASAPSLRLAYKLAGAVEGSSYAFGQASGNKSCSGAIVAYRNARFDIAGTIGTAISGGDIDAAGISLDADAILLAVYANTQTFRSFTTPSGMLPLLSDSDGSGASFSIFTQQLGAGATGDRISTPNGGGSSAGVLLGLKGA